MQEDAVQLAHQGSHAGQSALQRRLRYHFFFHGMNDLVEKHITDCFDCTLFTDKKCSEPLKHHKVPNKCWETVAVDLFGPLPSKKHVIVIQDLSSRFPVAKMVRSTSAPHVLPALADTYDLLGNPENQLSDNGPPFSSRAMEAFAEKRSINLCKTPPLHPSANPSETFMKPLGKAIKIAVRNKTPPEKAIKDLLESYRDTPHPATGVPPNSMIFRDHHQTQFPRRTMSDQKIEQARTRDEELKKARTDQINKSKYKQRTFLKVGDRILLRNNRSSKYHPYFDPRGHTITDILGGGSVIKAQREEDGKIFLRHPDDLKINITPSSNTKLYSPSNQQLQMTKWRNLVMSGKQYANNDYHSDIVLDHPVIPNIQPPQNVEPPQSPVREAPPPITPVRGRGRPPGQRQAPVLGLPPSPMPFRGDDMPELEPAVRRSARVATKRQGDVENPQD